MEKSLWYQLRNSFIPSRLRSEEFGDCLGRAPFHANSQGRVTFPGEGHLAGGSGRVLPGDLATDGYGKPALGRALARLHGLPCHVFPSTGRPVVIYSLQRREQRLRKVTVLLRTSWVVDGGAQIVLIPGSWPKVVHYVDSISYLMFLLEDIGSRKMDT